MRARVGVVLLVTVAAVAAVGVAPAAGATSSTTSVPDPTSTSTSTSTSTTEPTTSTTVGATPTTVTPPTTAATPVAGAAAAVPPTTTSPWTGRTDDADAIADPAILRAGAGWVVYSTQRLTEGLASQNVPMAASLDLASWTNAGDALPALPSWAVSGATWAPSAIELFDGTYRLYFAAHAIAGQQCIGVATATQAQGPFVSPSPTPLVCQASLGGSIDPDVFADGHGGLWLAWKNDGNSSGQRDWLWSQRLSGDGMGLVGAPTALLTSGARWERGIVENPDLVTLGGRLYLFYSGGNYASSSYATGYATCAGPSGPCTKVTTSRPVSSNSSAVGNGSLATFALPDGRTGIAWSAWPADQVGSPGASRTLFIGHIRLVAGVPQLIAGLGPDPAAPVTLAPTPTATGASVPGAVTPSVAGPAGSGQASPVRPVVAERGSGGPTGLQVALELLLVAVFSAAATWRARRRRRRSTPEPGPHLRWSETA
jgi:hypothetical protein